MSRPRQSQTCTALVWGWALAGIPIACAQQPAPAPQPAPANQPEVTMTQAPATFSSRVNLVSVPVVIRDRDGQAVGGLKQDDFRLFDKNKPQVITKFSVEASAAPAVPDSAAAAAPSPVAPAPPDSPKPPELPNRFVAYFFDDIHFKPADLLQARQAANRHLDQTLNANTRAGIFTTSGRVTQDFTSDPAKLHAAVNRIQPWNANSNPQQDCPPITYYVADVLVNQEHVLGGATSDDQIIRAMQTDQLLAALVEDAQTCLCKLSNPDCPPRFFRELSSAASRAVQLGMTDAKTALFTLRDLIRSMSPLPGSRTVVMVSSGFLMTAEHRLDENDIFDKAIHANVVINTLDVRGLYTPSISDVDGVRHAPLAAGVMAQADNTEASLRSDILAEFAANTGGTFFHNSNAIEDGLKQLAAQPDYVYVLGYSPDDLKFDGGYHKLKVTLKNGQSLTVEARRGYWAPNHAVDAAQQAREDLEEAVFSRDQMLDIPVKLHTEFFKQSEARAQLSVQTRVDLKGLKFQKAGGRNRDTLVVVTGLFDENGRYVKGIERTVNMQLRDQTLESALTSGLNVKEDFDVPPGRYVVRVVVRDSEGHSMAAQNEGVEIP